LSLKFTARANSKLYMSIQRKLQHLVNVCLPYQME